MAAGPQWVPQGWQLVCNGCHRDGSWSAMGATGMAASPQWVPQGWQLGLALRSMFMFCVFRVKVGARIRLWTTVGARVRASNYPGDPRLLLRDLHFCKLIVVLMTELGLDLDLGLDLVSGSVGLGRVLEATLGLPITAALRARARVRGWVWCIGFIYIHSGFVVLCGHC